MGTYIEKFEKLEKVSELHLKGYKLTEIARELNITPAHAKTLVDEYKEFIKERAQDDPEILDRLVENTLEVLEGLNMIHREAWLTYEKAKDFEMVNQQNASLKNLMDITEKRAKLLQLMGAKEDSGNTARLRKAERVNEIISLVLKEIIADCPKCRVEAQIRLAEAFDLMDRQDEAAEMNELAPQNNFIDVESQEDEAEAALAHEDMMGDVFSRD